jgi:novel plant SNARE
VAGHGKEALPLLRIFRHGSFCSSFIHEPPLFAVLFDQSDIQYWDDTLTEELKAIAEILDAIPNKSGMKKAAAIEDAKDKVRGAVSTKRSFKMEIRLIQDAQLRRKFEGRQQLLDQKLKGYQADAKAFESETQRGELFVQGEDGKSSVMDEKDGVTAGNKMLNEASHLQDKTQDSLSATKTMIADSKEVGVATLEELERQREVLGNIERETDRLDDNLARSEKLLKQFGRRMASDHFIQCFTVINVLLLCGVILYAVLKGKKIGGDDDAQPIDPTGASTSSAAAEVVGNVANRLFLRRRY